MVAVCPNCHAFLETQGADRQREIKANPANIRNGAFRAMLQYDKRNLVFRVGGNWYEDTPTILEYRDLPLIACRIDDNQALVSIVLLDRAGREVMRVEDNEVVFRVDALWDFECRHNVAIARSNPRDIALKMDFSKPDATIEGQLWAGGTPVRLGPEHTTVGGDTLKGCRIARCKVGIHIE
jgi:hypothetical protein